VSSAEAVHAPAGGLSGGSEAAPLGKHEELATSEPRSCTCGPAKLRLRSDQGELVRPRGGSVNRCDYCAKLAAIENGEMLALDALGGDAPTMLAILGTRTATLDMAAFRRGRDMLVRALRGSWPAFEYACEVEYTTGYGPRAGGERRPHWNWLTKGIPDDDVDGARELMREMWCTHVDAEPERQYVELLRSAGAALKYVTAHYMKASQRPPEGFTGQRFNCSRGYFGSITVTTARARARESLRLKRELWKAEQRGIEDAYDRELVAHQALAAAASTSWVLTGETGARLTDQALPPEPLHWRAFEALKRREWSRDGVTLPGRSAAAELLRTRTIAEAPELGCAWGSELERFYAELGAQLADLQRLTAAPAPARVERAGRQGRSTRVDASTSSPPAPNAQLLQERQREDFVAELWHAIELEAGSPPAHAQQDGRRSAAAREGQKRQTSAGL
jgi:hypothetical protein